MGNSGGPRVLVVAERLPSPVRSGGDLRTLAIISALARRATVAVVGLTNPHAPRPTMVDAWSASQARPPSSPVILRTALEHPDDPYACFAQDATVTTVREAISDFVPQVIIVSHLLSYRVLTAALDDALSPPVILDLDQDHHRMVRSHQQLESSGPSLPMRIRMLMASARYQDRVLGDPDTVWLSTESEERSIAGSLRPGVVAVIPNAVEVASSLSRGEHEPRRLLFPGMFAYSPNECAARELVSDIMPALPDHTLRLVGSAIPAWMRELRAANVTVDGPIDDMRLEFESASAVIIPLRGGTGSRLKILEAFATGTPVVSTAIGVEGLDVTDEKHVLLAESTDDLIAAIRRLDREASLRDRLARAAFALVRARYSVDALEPLVASALRTAIAASHDR